MADRQLIVLKNKLKELNLSSDNDDATGSSQGKAEVIRQLKKELKKVKALQKLLSELLFKSQEEAITKAVRNQTDLITVSFGAQNSGF